MKEEELKEFFDSARKLISREKRLWRLKELGAPQAILTQEKEMARETREKCEILANKFGLSEVDKERIYKKAELHELKHDRCWEFFERGAFDYLKELLRNYGTSWSFPEQKGDPKKSPSLELHKMLREEPLENLEIRLRNASTRTEAIQILEEALWRVQLEFYEVLNRVLTRHINCWIKERELEEVILYLQYEDDEALFS